MSYQIFTDSTANLLESQIKAYDLKILEMTFLEDGVEQASIAEDKITDLKEFYKKIRAGKRFTTSLPHLDEVEASFRDTLDLGRDILYIGFSSGLSSTFHAVETLMDQLREDYPDRKMIAVDTLAASMGQGLLVYYAVKQKEAGASIEEAAQWVEDHKLHLAHWFMVDDLMHLFRGGRVSRTSAWAGTVLNIKPVMHVNDEGKLIPMEKIRGRKKALARVFEHFQETAIPPLEKQMIYISHADCLDEAEKLAQMVHDHYKVDGLIINYIDPVIGSHCGAGTLAIFYLATER